MPLVPAKCTQCGANLDVDSTLEAVICPHCKTPFITEKAINNFNTTNITNIDTINAEVVNVENSDSADNLYKAGQTNLDFCDYEKASDVFQKMTETYPQDYRGWHGLLLAKTLNLQGEINNTSYLEYVKGLAKKLSFLQKDSVLVDFERINQYLHAQSNGVLDKELEKLNKSYGVQPIENKIRAQNRCKNIKRACIATLIVMSCLFAFLSIRLVYTYFSSDPVENHYTYRAIDDDGEKIGYISFDYDIFDNFFHRREPHIYKCTGGFFHTHRHYCFGAPSEDFSFNNVYNTTCTATLIIFALNYLFRKFWLIAMIVVFVFGLINCFWGRTPITATFDLSPQRKAPAFLKAIPIRSVLCVLLLILLAISLFSGVLAARVEFPDVYFEISGESFNTVSSALGYVSTHMIYTIAISLLYFCIGMIPFFLYFFIEKKQAKRQMEYELKAIKNIKTG